MKRWLIVLTVFLVACSTTGTKGPHDKTLERRVEGNRILRGDKLYAELVLIGKRDNRESYRGIAIHYVRTGQYEWISPEKRWTLMANNGEVIRNIEKLRETWVGEPRQNGYTPLKGSKPVYYKEYYGIEWRWDVKISGDGKFVTYIGNNFFFGQKTGRYKVK